MMERIRELAERGIAGKFWYEKAEESIRRVGGEEWDMLARLIATLSPQSSVGQNVGWALVALRHYREEGRGPTWGVLNVGRFSQVAWAVNDVLNGGLPRGPKVCSFYRALTGDREAVAIDQFVARAMGLETTRHLGENLYWRMAADLRWMAHYEMGWEPRQLQAALWVAAPRRRAGQDMSRELERSAGLLTQERLEVWRARGPRNGWE
jgi:hypothetical protein